MRSCWSCWERAVRMRSTRCVCAYVCVRERERARKRERERESFAPKLFPLSLADPASFDGEYYRATAKARSRVYSLKLWARLDSHVH
jgi:hypothetical protein